MAKAARSAAKLREGFDSPCGGYFGHVCIRASLRLFVSLWISNGEFNYHVYLNMHRYSYGNGQRVSIMERQ